MAYQTHYFSVIPQKKRHLEAAMKRVKRWELAKIEIHEKGDTKFTPLPVDPLTLYCMIDMFAHIVVALFNFCGHNFLVKYET